MELVCIEYSGAANCRWQQAGKTTQFDGRFVSSAVIKFNMHSLTNYNRLPCFVPPLNMSGMHAVRPFGVLAYEQDRITESWGVLRI